MAGSDKTNITPPRWLLAELTYKCPLQCPYCSNPLDYVKRSDEISTADWKRVLSEARKMGAVQLGFSGGEPLTRQDLPELVEHARELGYYSNLITSGYGLTEEKIIQLKEQTRSRPFSKKTWLPDGVMCGNSSRKHSPNA